MTAFNDPIASAHTRVRRLGTRDLVAYKTLRDTLLATHPDAFTADARTEIPKPPEVYLGRFGIGHDDPATFTLGAFDGEQLVGAISCQREPQPKVLHLAQVVGMMVQASHAGRGVGRVLLRDCIAQVRAFSAVRQLTLTVTSSNAHAVRLYESAGFVRYGTLPRALKVDGRFIDKDLMLLVLGSG